MPAVIEQFRGQHLFLSNFAMVHSGVAVRAGGRTISALTTEHLFAALKTTDRTAQDEILAANGPRRAKALGRKAPLRPDWEQVKDTAMGMCLAAKFSTEHPELRAALAATGDALLVEGNSWGDRYWGVDLATGAGQNRLGLALMAQRARILLEDGS